MIGIFSLAVAPPPPLLLDWLNQHGYTQWESYDTPLWLWLYDSADMERLRNMGDRLPAELEDGYIPVRLETGVEFNQVVDDVARQLKEIREAIRIDSHST